MSAKWVVKCPICNGTKGREETMPMFIDDKGQGHKVLPTWFPCYVCDGKGYLPVVPLADTIKEIK